MESIKLDVIRKCEYIRKIKFNTGKEAVIARTDIPIEWEDKNGIHQTNQIILTARHENYNIMDISYFPTFVYVTTLNKGTYEDVKKVKAKDLIVFGVGELYRNYDDAKNHKFD